LAGSPGQPWQITGPGLAGQAKFGQYLQDAKNPRSISQTEKAVEREQIRSNEQVLPTPGIANIASTITIAKLSQYHSEKNPTLQRKFRKIIAKFRYNILTLLYSHTPVEHRPISL
jgi:hypothetical protein